MARFSDPLSRVRVDSPCLADWDSMIGDQRVRFWGQCELKVDIVSAMSKTQAEYLIAGTERRPCIRYYRRKDGSILTQDCPVGLARVKQRLSRIKRAVASVLVGFFAGTSGTLAVNRVADLLTDPILERPQIDMGMVAEPVEPIVRGLEAGQMEMGDVFVERRVVWPKKRRRR